jgi:hypothetical protein
MGRQVSLIFVVSLVGILLCAGAVLAAADQGYDLPWWTVDGGGGHSQGPGYVLDGSIGQPDAKPVLNGGNYRLMSGFWGGAAAVQYTVYLPLVVKGK